MLGEFSIVVLDCQATGACPRGHLLELGWARLDPIHAARDDAPLEVRSRLVALPDGVDVPRAVARITGITNALVAGGVQDAQAWGELLSDASAIAQRPPRAVAHRVRTRDVVVPN